MIEAQVSRVIRFHGMAAIRRKGETAEEPLQPGGKVLGCHRICAVLSQMWSAIEGNLFI